MIGGIVGGCDNNSKVINCYNTGKIISNGTQTYRGASGIVGQIYGNGEIYGCYNNGIIEGTNCGTGGIVGEIYTAADIYFNPTYADNFPTTNLESLACGTPVFTYNTGGSTECLTGNNGAITNLKDFSENYKKYLTQKFEINKVKTKLEMESDYINIYNNL